MTSSLVAAGAGVPDAASRLARARASLARVEHRLAHLEKVVGSTAKRNAPTPPLMGDELSKLRQGLLASVLPLRGLHQRDISAFFQEVHEVEARLAELERHSISAVRTPTVAKGLNAQAHGQSPTWTGAISGTVTEAATGNPIAGVIVRVVNQANQLESEAVTSATGAFVVNGLPTGTYVAYIFDAQGYIPEVFSGIWCEGTCLIWSGTPIAVTNGATTPGINFALERYATISGTVTDAATSQPLGGVALYLYKDNDFYNWVNTGSNGAFQFSQLTPGTYFLRTFKEGYLDQLYQGIPCEEWCDPFAGTPIVLGDGTHLGGIDFALQPAGSISGTVTEQVTGTPLSAIVNVYDQSGQWVTYAVTDFDGTFRISDLESGTYYALAFATDHATVIYDGIICTNTCDPTSGTPIAVIQGQETAGVSFSLPRMGAIAGQVTDAATHFPISFTAISVFKSDGTFAGYDYTDAMGSFNIGGLAPGTYFVWAQDPEYLDEVYDNILCQPSCDLTSGTPVTVAFNATTTGIDFALDLGGGITGTVTAASSGSPISGVLVQVFDASGNQVGLGYSSFGNYVVRDLLPGTYFARADGSGPGYLSELYDNIPCDPSCNVTTGTPIAVTAGQATTAINFALDRLGAIAGTVRDAVSSAPIAHAFVNVYDSSGTYVGFQTTQSNGTFLISGLQPGSYFLMAFNDGHVAQLYSGIDCLSPCTVTSGTAITVSLNTTTGGIDFSLSRLGIISGHVTELGTGSPLPNTVIHVYDASGSFVTSAWTDGSGAYQVSGLYPGTYFAAAENPLGYVLELYTNIDCSPSCDVTTGTPLSAAINTVTSGVDFILRKPFFQDVTLTSPGRRSIEALYAEGVSSGCSSSPALFCPTSPMTRRQVAVWLAKAKTGGAVPVSGTVPGLGSYNCVSGGTSVFLDVAPGEPTCKFIHYLAAQSITSGCGGGNFCPDSPVTRAQMAVFTAKATAPGPIPSSGTVPGMGNYDCTAGGTSVFNDVAPEAPTCRFIHYVAAQGISGGCGGGNYCPNATLNRAQGSVFTAKGFGIRRYRP
ncbi:MAG: carboxypeptidase regulatory-like domain-containing protein [Thermoanaerobaculum sp.]